MKINITNLRTLLTLALLVLSLAGRGAQAQAFDRDYRESINGTKLHFRVRGANEKNPYLLILHGGPGFSAHMFYPWGKSIEPAVNVVYLDQRGSGESERLHFKNMAAPAPEEVKDYTVANLLRDIEGVRAFLQIKRWYVLGHSWGGMLGLEYVTTYPASVLGYLHVDGLLSQPLAQDAMLDFADRRVQQDEQSADKSLQERAKRLKAYLPATRKLPAGPERLFASMQFAFALFSEMYYADAKVGNAYNAQITQALKAYNLPANASAPAYEPAAALVVSDHYATRDDTPLLALVKCPTLVINGKQDGLITPRNAEMVQKEIPGAKLLILDRCGHFPFAEQPEAFTQAVLDFVKSGGKPARN